MKLTSPNFTNHDVIPKTFTCDGDDISPALEWSDIPEETKSFVLVVRDPDAPMKTEWVHWVVINIPALTTTVSQGQVPAGGTEVENDFGRATWGGPCPPDGKHRYYFEIYALSTSVIGGNSLATVKEAMNGYILSKTELMGTYNRSA